MTKTLLKPLILGVSGQVGFELAHLIKDVLGTSADLASRQKPGWADAKNWKSVDFANSESLTKLPLGGGYNLILNAAAYTAVDKAESDKEAARAINAEAVATLAKLAAEANAAFVHFSTDYVFSGKGQTPFNETDPRDPQNFYGLTKADGEKALEGSNCRWVNFRTQWVYAPQGNNFVKTMLKLGRDRKELKIIDDQWGAPTSARAIAMATLTFIKNELERSDVPLFSKTGGHYHLACQGETTWYRFAKAIFEEARALGFPLQVESVLPITTEDYPTPASRPKNSRLNTQKLRDAGVPLPTWQAELKDQLPKIIAQL